jgi:hypothetical protein
MLKFINAIKAALQSKKTLDNREGRFLTIYLDNGKRYNGKVLAPGYLKSEVQLAINGQRIKVRNNQIKLVSTDHAVIKFAK